MSSTSTSSASAHCGPGCAAAEGRSGGYATKAASAPPRASTASPVSRDMPSSAQPSKGGPYGGPRQVPAIQRPRCPRPAPIMMQPALSRNSPTAGYLGGAVHGDARCLGGMGGLSDEHGEFFRAGGRGAPHDGSLQRAVVRGGGGGRP